MQKTLSIIILLLSSISAFSQDPEESAEVKLFDKHYFSAVEAENLEDKIHHLVQARFICEQAYGTLEPVFLEVCMVLGQCYEEKGDYQSAAAIYEDGLVQSVGLYSLNDPDVKEYYNTIEQAYRKLQNSNILNNVLVWNRTPLFKRDLKMNDDDPQTDIVIKTATKDQIACIDLINENKIKEAEALYLRNIKLLEDSGKKDSKIYRKSLSGLANVYQALHNYEAAKRFAGNAKVLFEKNRDYGFSYIQCLSRCAVIEHGLNNQNVARLMIEVALMRLFEGIQDLEKEAATDGGKAYQSIQYLIYLLNNAGVIYSSEGRINNSLSALNLSIALSDRLGENTFTAKGNIALAYMLQGNFLEASKLLAEVYPLAAGDNRQAEIGFWKVVSDFFLKKDASLLAVEVSNSFCENFNEMFSFLSTDERNHYWTHFEFVLPILNMAILETKNELAFGTIYNNILKSKEIRLRTSNQIRDAIRLSTNEDLNVKFDSLLKMKRALLKEQDNAKRTTLLAEINSIDKLLTKEVSQYAEFKKNINVNWTQVQQSLEDDAVAIEFYNIPEVYRKETALESTSEARYCAVVIRKNYAYPHIIPLVKEDELLALGEEELYSLPKLYDIIWGQLIDELKGVRNVYFAADRELHRIAIEYAVNHNRKAANEIWNIYRLTSTRELVDSHTKKISNQAVLYGGLRYDLGKEELIAESRSLNINQTKTVANRSVGLDNYRYGVKFLPGTLSEIKEISMILDDSSIVHSDIIGVSGTEESFKELSGQSFSILHLATHGFYWGEKESSKRSYMSFLPQNRDSNLSKEDKALMRSGLFFSGANISLKGGTLPVDVEDGVLTAMELSALNFGGTELVVLSACRSGLGEISGDGVFGLQRGFKLAGAKTLLMSLWPVDDTATKMLMVEFYKHYINGSSKIESLKKAQQYVKSQPGYEDPEFWAGFILLDALN